MKFVLLLFAFITFSSFAQQRNSLFVVTNNSKESVELKWLPDNYDTWILGMKNGYHIDRIEMQSVSGKWQVVKQVRLTTAPIKPWTEERIRKEAVTNPDLKNVDLMLAGNELNEKFKPEGIKEGADVQSQKEFVFVLSLFAQTMKNKAAEAMGAYFKDSTASPGKTYLYRVIINAKDGIKGDAVVDRNVFPRPAKITGFSSVNIHKGVDLLWVNQAHSGIIYYDIYRSEQKNKDFTKVNDLPYIGELGVNIDDNRIKYTDTFPSLDKTYYYKVVGVNAFEKETQPSVVLEVKAQYFLQTAPRITNGVSPDNEEIQLTWEAAEAEKPYIKGFSVLHASSPTGKYARLNDKILSASTYNYKDLRKNKNSSNYYSVCAYGTAGDSVCSVLKNVFLVDSVPPGPPVITSGICDSNGVVTISWKKGLEGDLLGYRIFRTYYTHKEPERITSGYIQDTTFVDTIGLKSGFKKVYYGVSTIDQHFNPSPLCTYYEVKMPDNNPPSNAVFKNYKAGYTGILLEWLPGSSEDIKTQYLFRKSEFDFAWQPFLKLTGDSLMITQIRDTLTKSNIWYEYALMAEDSSGLKSEMSESLRILQPEKNPFPVVKNLKAIMSRENKMVKLTWDFEMNATGFKIMRGKKGKPIETYEFVSGSKREFYDKWLTPNTDYIYAIVAEVPGGRRSQMSNKVEVKY